ncbi:MAG: PASTA domain-containing protein [Gemmatimonadetes bacterium]|nr:PASTA domain-containing protein [Gemmatimonadota bacterium]
MKGAGAERRAPAGRRRLLLGVFLLVTMAGVGRAFQIQVLEGGKWRAQAVAQHGDTLRLPAPRGTMYDRNGIPLAATQEVYRVAIAPREVADTARVLRLLQEHCARGARAAERRLLAKRRGVPVPGQYPVSVREALDHTRGIYFESTLSRFYPHGALALSVLGAVGGDGEGQSGLELELDSILRGRPGRATVRRDAEGNALPGAMLRTHEPEPGRDVYLTLDLGLQEIAEAALEQAVSAMDARGGELLLADPNNGEILAAASRRGTARAFTWRAVNEPYEPGSTLKPFTVAGLLALGRVTLADSVFAEDGSYEYPGRRRPITDVHPYGMLSVADALRKSSNIALVKLATRLSPSEHYRLLRDFGFGSPTGVTYPSESAGHLFRLERWTRQSQPSLAMGYEISVTPLQMAMAYGAIANGGLLLEPRLVREVRGRDGLTQYVLEPRAVRRAVPARVAAELRTVLEGAVTDGTAQQAALGPFAVAGKTGTAKISAGPGAGYQPGAYYASFAGFFPAQDPQLVFLVKIDEPHGAYYGGVVAAPVIRVALEAALAARATPLDRRAVALPAPLLPGGGEVRYAAVLPAPREPAVVTPVTRRGELRRPQAPAAPAGPPRVGPDVAGLPLRDAVRTLHAAGLRVRVAGHGRVRASVPAPGDTVRAGTVVRVEAEGA